MSLPYGGFGELFVYKNEQARGIVHTPEWQTFMASEQERFVNLYLKTLADQAARGASIGVEVSA